MPRKVLVVVAVALIILFLYSARVYLKYRALRRANARIAAQLDVTYQAELVRFQRAVALGTARSEVEKYLTSQQIPFSNDQVIVVNLGDEPGDGFVCDRWRVSVYFEFDHAQTQTGQAPTSKLTAISLNRIGHCL